MSRKTTRAAAKKKPLPRRPEVKKSASGQKRVAHVPEVGAWAKAAPTFAALGDPTRLSLLAKLGRGHARSISQLAHGSHLTRQAITKHLRVLERARIVRCVRSGRHALSTPSPATNSATTSTASPPNGTTRSTASNPSLKPNPEPLPLPTGPRNTRRFGNDSRISATSAIFAETVSPSLMVSPPRADQIA